MKLNILIVTKYDWKSRDLKHEAIKHLMKLSPDIEDITFTVVKKDLGTPEVYKHTDGKMRIKESWFEKNISIDAKLKGYTHACFQFSEADGKKWGIASGHRGLNFRDGDFFGEFWVKCNEMSVRNYKNGKKRNTYETDFPHEIGHEFTREGLTVMEMHDYDYQTTIDNIEGFYSNLHITQKSIIYTLYQRILNLNFVKSLLEKPMLPITNFEKVSQHFMVADNMYKSKVHPGTDWATPIGTPIYAPLNGYISAVFKNHVSLGNACYFHFKFNNKEYSMRVLHLSKVPVVKTYLKGEVIGYSGNTGKTTGPHIHIDLWKGNTINSAKIYTKQGVVENLLDPYKFFKGINI